MVLHDPRGPGGRDGGFSYREIYESAPVSIWVEDWSRVKPIIDGLARRGVKNWRRYFERRRDRVIEAANAIEVIDISAATLRIYGAENKQEVIVSARGENMDPGELITFCEQLASFAGATSRFEIDVAGERIPATASLRPFYDPDGSRTKG